MWRYRTLLSILVLSLLLSSCQTQPASPPQPGTQPSSPTSTPAVGGPASAAFTEKGMTIATGGQGDSTGLHLRLSEGSEAASAGPAVPVAGGTPLSEAETRLVLDRLPALPAGAGDQQAFNFPKSSLPPPRPGQTIQASFPPTGTAQAVTATVAGPLEVLRFSPEGDVPLAPNLSLTFSQPMVALTAHEELAAQSVPVKLSPEPPGAWRWVGAKTLMFEASGPQGPGTVRLPMATFYTVTVPAGTLAATGGKLDKALTFTFNTPPPKVESSYPNGGPELVDPLLFVAFDQRVDPGAVLPTIKINAGSGEYRLRPATKDELKANADVQRLAGAAGDGHWLAFKADKPFPGDQMVVVSVGPGAPSAEGPRKTATTQSFSFRTFGPLRIVQSQCGYDNNCPPFSPWIIRFSNPPDVAAFDESMLTITPALAAANINVYGDTIQIQGASQGRTTYNVTVRATLKDQFGQTLGKDQAVTFKVGSAQQTIYAPGNGFLVLDPGANKPAYSVFTINYDKLAVQAYSVKPEDWPAYQTWLQNYSQNQQSPAPPGQRVLDQTVNIGGQPDQLSETSIDLSALLKGGLGQLVLVVVPGPQRDPNQRPAVQAWVEGTRIGLDAAVDNNRMLAWANALTDGAPLAGVQLSLANTSVSATTGADGTATLPLPETSGAQLLIARLGNDTAFLPQNAYWGGSDGWKRNPTTDSLRWMIFDDRGMYRPGEEVHIKGWLRRVGAGPAGDILPLQAAVKQVSWQLNDPQGNQVAKGTMPVNPLGGFDTAIKLPDNMNLGQAQMMLTAEGAGNVDNSQWGHQFQVQEFRRPEFEVSAGASDGPHFVGGNAVTTVTARYYAGGALPTADVTWTVTSSPTTYSPPGWDGFTFGTWTPWWITPLANFGGPSRPFGGPFQPPSAPQTFSGHTDSSGKHQLRIDFDSTDKPEPASVVAQATVMDVNRQAWSAEVDLLVHPAALYVGLRSERMFVDRDQPLRVDAIVVDVDGKVSAGRPISMTASRLEYKYKPAPGGGSQYVQVETAPQQCTIQSGPAPVTCTFETPVGGEYRITASVTDDQGRRNQSQLSRWVSEGNQPPARNVEQEQVTLIPDKKDYKAGDTAEILVQAPFAPAEGVMTLRRSGIVSSQRFSMSSQSFTLKVPIVDAYVPNVQVQVDLVGAASRVDDAGNVDAKLPKRPAFASGDLDLSVPALARTMKVTVTPRAKALDPGGQTTLDIALKDAAGQPVKGAELAVVVVDEAVLALTGYQMQNPIDVFYSPRSPDTADYHLRSNVVLANPGLLQPGQQAVEKLALSSGGGARSQAMPAATAAAAAPAAAPTAAPGAATDASGRAPQPPPIALRTNFNALAVFSPTVPTDVDGLAQVEVKLPDSLTRYRVMVVAVDAGGKQFGEGEATLTARLPLMVRASPPRFLNFGDRFELPVVLQNQTDAPMAVDVAVRATNVTLAHVTATVTNVVSFDAQTVTVPANDRIEVRFPASADQPGTARFQVAAAQKTGGAAADASQFELPVYTPATTEAFATYGQIDGGDATAPAAIAQPVIAPSNVYTQFGGLEITTSSTALQALTDAVLYLVSYPYECSEQLASRVLAVASLRDVLTAFQAKDLPSPEQMNATVASDIERLRSLQNDDGGFPLWRRGDDTWPYVTVYVTHALQQARSKDYAVPDDMLTKAGSYLQNIESHIPAWYGQDARRSIVAYSLYVRSLMGDKDTAKARQMINSVGPDKLPTEAVGWLLSVLTGDPGSTTEVQTIRRSLNNRATETAGAASFTTSYGDDDYLLMHSSRRTDAVILDALMADQPKSDLIPKVVQGLLAHRTAGRWESTQENSWVLLALDRYFNTYEAQTPDFVARLWLGDQYAGEATFKGRTTDRQQVNIPMAVVARQAGAQNLILSKEGPGRLYYRLGMSYAPQNLKLAPMEQGFTVERTYEAIDKPTDVSRDADGTWHVKAGAQVRVRVTMVAPSRRYHVALTDPLPAGFEAENPALAVTGSIPADQNPTAPQSRFFWWWGPWYQYQNLRDQRAEAFTALLWEGVYTYSYVARATTPGDFIVPPSKAEEMYAPETFGRGATDRVIIK